MNGRYWSNSGQRSARALNGSVANDPKRHRGLTSSCEAGLLSFNRNWHGGFGVRRRGFHQSYCRVSDGLAGFGARARIGRWWLGFKQHQPAVTSVRWPLFSRALVRWASLTARMLRSDNVWPKDKNDVMPTMKKPDLVRRQVAVFDCRNHDSGCACGQISEPTTISNRLRRGDGTRSGSVLLLDLIDQAVTSQV